MRLITVCLRVVIDVGRNTHYAFSTGTRCLGVVKNVCSERKRIDYGKRKIAGVEIHGAVYVFIPEGSKMG